MIYICAEQEWCNARVTKLIPGIGLSYLKYEVGVMPNVFLNMEMKALGVL